MLIKMAQIHPNNCVPREFARFPITFSITRQQNDKNHKRRGQRTIENRRPTGLAV
jgi:hypothetical protein